MKKFVPIAICLCLFTALPLFSQSNQILDEILAEEELSAESAAYLIYSLGREGPEPASQAEALNRMGEAFSGMGEILSAGEYAFLLQNGLEVPRGFFSTLFPGPRYSFRDLKFMGMIQERIHPGDRLSGEQALRILGRVLSEKEERR